MQNTVQARKNGSAARIARQIKSPQSNTVAALPVFNPDEILFEHVAATLPDSLSLRLAVLRALRAKINYRHPAFTNIGAQISALELIGHLPLTNEGTK